MNKTIKETIKWLDKGERQVYVVLPDRKFIIFKEEKGWYVGLIGCQFIINKAYPFQKKKTALEFVERVKNLPYPHDMTHEEVETALKTEPVFQENIKKLGEGTYKIAKGLKEKE